MTRTNGAAKDDRGGAIAPMTSSSRKSSSDSTNGTFESTCPRERPVRWKNLFQARSVGACAGDEQDSATQKGSQHREKSPGRTRDAEAAAGFRDQVSGAGGCGRLRTRSVRMALLGIGAPGEHIPNVGSSGGGIRSGSVLTPCPVAAAPGIVPATPVCTGNCDRKGCAISNISESVLSSGACLTSVRTST